MAYEDDLVRALSGLSEIRRAANRLGLTADEVAARVALMLDFEAVRGRIPSDPRRQESDGYKIMRAVRDATRALS